MVQEEWIGCRLDTQVSHTDGTKWRCADEELALCMPFWRVICALQVRGIRCLVNFPVR